MRALKILVIVMGVMLVGGFATLVAVIAGRVAQKQAASSAQQFAAPAIELPAGARVDTMAVGSDRLVLNLFLPDGNRELVVIDLASGRRLGSIPLR